MNKLSFQCECGTVTGQVDISNTRDFVHLKCMCDSCLAFAHLGDHQNTHIDADGFVDLMQALPQNVDIHSGHKTLTTLRLSQKGPMRWYADCCNTPLWITLGTPKIPFTSFLAANLSNRDQLGSVSYYAFADKLPKAERPKPNGPWGGIKLVFGLIARTFRVKIAGRMKDTPFFDASGKLISNRSPMTKAEIAALFGM